ncbi:MAG: hypothetical protein ABJC89_18640 [Acidobacteriota bacterium]
MTAGLYETEVRGTAVGVMLGAGACGALLAPAAITLLQQYAGRQQAAFVGIGVAAVLAAMMIACAPATPAWTDGASSAR